MKTITERAIEAVMRGDLSEAQFDLVADIDLRVQRQITCPVTGEVLDSRTAALITVADQKVAIAPHAVERAVELTEHLGAATVQAIPEEVLGALR